MIELRPAVEADLEAVAVFMADPGVRRWWGDTPLEHLREQLPAAFVILVDGELAGWLQYEEETCFQYPSVDFDIALADRCAGRGVAPEALRLAVAHFVGRGHHRFTIVPAVANERAVRAYEKAGFTAVGVSRAASRVYPGEAFEDELMMDLIVSSVSASAGDLSSR